MIKRSTRLVLLAIAVLFAVPSGSAAAHPSMQPQPLAISPESGPPGTVVQYSGSGFTPGGRVSVLLIGGLGLIVDEPAASPGGTITGSFRMPQPRGPGVAELSYGPVDVFAIDEATGRESPYTVFLLTMPPDQMPDPALPSTWYFAEGSSQPPFDTWFLVQNTSPEAAQVRFTFQLQTGGTGSQTVTRDFTVGPTSRLSVFANEVVPGAAFSTRIDASNSVFAERSMFVGFEGHVVAGIPSPATRWLFAEGSSQQPFHTWLLLQNPNSEPATATVRYLVQGGPPRTQTLSLPANSRASIFTNQVIPDAAFSMRVESDAPVIAERAMYRFPGNAAMGVAGVTSAARTWFFAEGSESARGLPTDTWLLLQNPNEFEVPAMVTIIREEGDPVDISMSLPPSSRQSVYLNQVGDFGSFGIQVEAGAGIVAERSMFFGGEPRGAHATAGSPALAGRWHLAEGSTAAPFDEVIAIVNPNERAATSEVEFQLADGRTVERNFTVPSRRKLSIRVDDIVPDAAVSAEVSTSLPTVVERTMFFEKSGGLGVHNTIGIRSE